MQGKKNISYVSNRKVFFQVSGVCLAKTVLTAAATTFSKLMLLVVRAQRPTTSKKTVLASGFSARCISRSTPLVKVSCNSLLRYHSTPIKMTQAISYTTNESLKGTTSGYYQTRLYSPLLTPQYTHLKEPFRRLLCSVNTHTFCE